MPVPLFVEFRRGRKIARRSNGGKTTERAGLKPSPGTTSLKISRVLSDGQRKRALIAKIVKSRKHRLVCVFYRKRRRSCEDERRSETSRARGREGLALSGRGCRMRGKVGGEPPFIWWTQTKCVLEFNTSKKYHEADSPAGARRIWV